MGLPETVRVKISTEEAGYIAMTAVAAREMPLRELVEMMLGLTGKDPARVHELLLRGTLVSGASRLRWAGWDVDRAAIEALLAVFPDPDPGRPFAPTRCVRAVLRGPGAHIEITREAGTERRLLRRRTFWSALMEAAGAGAPAYVEYSYKDRADRYTLPLAPETAASLRRSAGALRYTSLEAQVRRVAFDTLDLYVARGS
jgi:hypothetical protein